MSVLFEKKRLKNIDINNRFVRSATWEGLAEKSGEVTDQLINYVEKLVHGGVGLVISGHAYVAPEGQASPYQMGIYSEDMKPGLMSLADAVHESSGKIIAQIAHGGAHALGNITGETPMGPSVLQGKKGPVCREMTRDEIGATAAAFGLAALRAKDCGYDGVQIHAAHGYLISEFLSPDYNRRTDEFGGSLENRFRLLSYVYDEVRKNVGDEFLVGLKINSCDFTEKGFSTDEMIRVVENLENKGLDFVELSGGTPLAASKYSTIRSGKDGGIPYYLSACAELRKKLAIPLMVVGGVRTFQAAELIIKKNMADFVALSRPLIREPGIVNRWKDGDLAPSGCISCNKCFRPALTGKGISCVEKSKQEKREKAGKKK